MDSLLIALEENFKQVPNQLLCQKIYQFDHLINTENSRIEEEIELKRSIIEMVKNDEMAPYFNTIRTKYNWTTEADDVLLTSMRWLFMTEIYFVFQHKGIHLKSIVFHRVNNEAELLKIDNFHKDAIENAGDMEVLNTPPLPSPSLPLCVLISCQ